MAQVAAGLAAVHEQNLVHRDIKPSNIRVHLMDDGNITAKIIDLGLAKSLDEPGDQTAISAPGWGFRWYAGVRHISSYPVKQLFKHQNPADSWTGVPGRTNERGDLKLPRPDGNSKARTGVRSPKGAPKLEGP